MWGPVGILSSLSKSPKIVYVAGISTRFFDDVPGRYNALEMVARQRDVNEDVYMSHET